MNILIIITVLLSAALSNAGGYCNPERSKPCGNGCIALYKQCRTPWTTMKVGVNPNKSSKPVYANPKLVEKAPSN